MHQDTQKQQCMYVQFQCQNWSSHGRRSPVLAWDDWKVIQLLVSFAFSPEEISPPGTPYIGSGKTGSLEQSAMAVFSPKSGLHNHLRHLT